MYGTLNSSFNQTAVKTLPNPKLREGGTILSYIPWVSPLVIVGQEKQLINMNKNYGVHLIELLYQDQR